MNSWRKSDCMEVLSGPAILTSKRMRSRDDSTNLACHLTADGELSEYLLGDQGMDNSGLTVARSRRAGSNRAPGFRRSTLPSIGEAEEPPQDVFGQSQLRESRYDRQEFHGLGHGPG